MSLSLTVVYLKVLWLDHNSSQRTQKISKRQIVSHSVRHHLYADDTQLQARVRPCELRSCEYKIERCIGAIKDWFWRTSSSIKPWQNRTYCLGSKARLNRLQQEDVSKSGVRHHQTIWKCTWSRRATGFGLINAYTHNINRLIVLFHLRRRCQLRRFAQKRCSSGLYWQWLCHTLTIATRWWRVCRSLRSHCYE